MLIINKNEMAIYIIIKLINYMLLDGGYIT